MTPEPYRTTRKEGTEGTFTGKDWSSRRAGLYRCTGCGAPLFSSEAKFASGSGWPSYYAPAREEHVKTKDRRSHGVRRTQMLCATCDAHLGHLFDDPSQPTGKRYCINPDSLDFDAGSSG